MLKSRQHKIGRSEDGEVKTSPPRSAAKKRIEEAATKVSEFQDKDAGLGQPGKRATILNSKSKVRGTLRPTPTRGCLLKRAAMVFFTSG